MNRSVSIQTDKATHHIYISNRGSGVPTIFLHGFTGSHHSWDEIVKGFKRPAITIDLPGHGKSTFNNLDADYSIEDWCEDFNEILYSLDIHQIDLCGYSMGGRLAIGFAAKYPDKINKLILESASYGIEDKKNRRERFQEDLKLAHFIEKDLPAFVQKWENSPLFLKQKDRSSHGFLNQQKDRLSHNPKQLSKALKSFSQGNMGFYKESFEKFQFPITVINGSEDTKYTDKGKILSAINQNVKHFAIDLAGHNIHLENLRSFIDCLK